MAVPVSELQKVAPSSVIELFVLELNTTQHGVTATYRFHAGANMNANGEVVWAGNNYLRFPIEAEGFEYSGNGQLPRPKIRCSNILGSISAILLTTPGGLGGAKVTRIRTLARYIDGANFPGGTNPYGTPDSTAEFPREVYYIDRKTVETRDVVEFELAAAFDLAGVRAPKRQCIANICQWTYKSTECGYTGAAYYDANDNRVASSALDVCGKRLSSCTVRFGQYFLSGTVTSGSNVLTVASTANVATGETVQGFALPSGTTVSAITSATTLELSNNATANPNVTVTGTPSTTAATIEVASAAGLSIGMTVSGPYMNGQTITAINGTTLTLSERPYSFSRNGTYNRSSPYDGVLMNNTSGIVANMRIFGSFSLDTIVVTVNTNVGFAFAKRLTTRPEDEAKVVVYFMPASVSAASYVFTASTRYVFRVSNGLPFGSFPGAGMYTT